MSESSYRPKSIFRFFDQVKTKGCHDIREFYLEDVYASALSSAQDVAEKAKVLTMKAKLRLSISHERSKITQTQTRLGELYFRDYSEKKEPDPAEYLPYCAEIDKCQEKIAELEAQISALSGGEVPPEEPLDFSDFEDIEDTAAPAGDEPEA